MKILTFYTAPIHYLEKSEITNIYFLLSIYSFQIFSFIFYSYQFSWMIILERFNVDQI